MTTEFETVRGAVERAGDGAERCTVRARVPHGLRYFEGHFPGQPIVPGIAQLLPLVYREAQGAWPDLPPPTSLKRLKFLEALRPGDELELHLVRESDKLRFEIHREELLCTRGVLRFEPRSTPT